jgi:adenine-specific DNA-methyltransferase
MAKKKPTAKTSIPVEVIKHSDTRKNIPTEQLRDFMPEQPVAPKLYPRDVSLDPQLVWKGKDEQDAKPLEVPVVPIYIQEKIHPQAIIEDLKARQPQPEASEKQLDLFADFNGIDTFDKKVDFYHHDQHWSNRMILGDSLAVMTSLAEKEGLKGQVQTIYFDPPYGIKFGSNWQVSTRKRDVKDGKAEDATRQPEQVRAFRDTWELGIHSYLAYLRDRLTAARDLLTETGSVFVQIGDENVHLVRSVMDEVFGSENFCSIITFAKTSGQSDYLLSSVSDYIIWYAKNQEYVKYRQLYLEKNLSGAGGSYYTRTLLPDGTTRTLTDEETDAPETLPTGSRIYRLDNLISQRPPQGADLREFVFQGKAFTPGKGTYKSDLKGLQTLASAGRIEARSGSLAYVRYLDDFPVFGINSSWTDTAIAGRPGDKIYVVQTASRVIERCLLMTTDPGDLVLDPTCGSGTTAYVAEQWGRRWITLDTSRVALALARTRLMAARFPYYLLADSIDGRKKSLDLSGPLAPAAGERAGVRGPNGDSGVEDRPLTPTLSPDAGEREKDNTDIKKGFVYKRVPHVTLKSIANNPDIKEGMTRAQIDAAIAKHADTELLFDKPYEDNSKVRVTGPFTVESLSPHRRLTVEQKKERAAGKDGLSVRVIGPDQFGTMIIDNLRKAGIQARDKKERLKFDTLEPFAGEWLHASGEFTDANGDSKRVAICIGPEHGTVGPELVKEAAKEALRGVGFDLLYVLGFAFDPHVDLDLKNYGKLRVEICRMNPDLSMGDELLKKTGAGNLFMVFGEPDIELRSASLPLPRIGGEGRGEGAAKAGTGTPHPDPLPFGRGEGKGTGSATELVVEIKGVDVYDPTTGEIRSHSTDDIACWFIDTDYDGESFFVRHAYFTGAEQPYDKLKRALKADIDEAAWSALYSTTSQPFPKPKSGKIAVKVINHYGDEVLKVYPVK